MRVKLLGIGVALMAGLAALPAAAQPRATPCRTWHVRRLLTVSKDWLESLAFDGRGGMTISALLSGRVLRLTRGGHLSTLVSGLHAPGGQLVRGHYLYFTTGDIEPTTPTGTIDRFDLRTNRMQVWARRLTMPNGLAFLPNGDAIVTRDDETGAPATDVTRVPARRPRRPRINWVRIPETNGVVVDPSGRWLYLDHSSIDDGLIVRVRISHPATVQAVGRLNKAVLLDDMSIDARGVLWIADFGGSITRLDPRTHASCTIASGLKAPTAVVFGGRGWPRGDLFVTSATGALYELSASKPPPLGR